MPNTPRRGRPGRPPKSESGDAKARLIDAALTLFAAKGFTGTSIRAIAREAGLSDSALYAHFEDKQAIFGAAIATLGAQDTAAPIAGIDPALAASDPGGYLRCVADRAVSAWETPEARRIAGLMAQDRLIHEPALVAGVVTSVHRLAGSFAAWIEDGRVRADLGSPLDLGYAFFTPIVQARLLWQHDSATPEDLRKARERSVRHTEFFIKTILTADRERPNARR
ncbi:TetR/AcrR family transcriptional regulator [Actinomadura sp. 9N215]|uniref:TetR/AcrR family transcriptional regulator n=1 Tax=Actinomadura sp. 9N215 TaxID=3375150 RepID=UPI00379A5835